MQNGDTIMHLAVSHGHALKHILDMVRPEDAVALFGLQNNTGTPVMHTFLQSFNQSISMEDLLNPLNSKDRVALTLLKNFEGETALNLSAKIGNKQSFNSMVNLLSPSFLHQVVDTSNITTLNTLDLTLPEETADAENANYLIENQSPETKQKPSKSKYDTGCD